jgi:hypothetical protein
MEEQKATKVTLYLPPELHRQLRIRSAVEGEAMSSIAKRAIDFYLAHSELVDEGFEVTHGHSHQVYDCPSCATSVVVREGELVELARMAALTAPNGATLNDADLTEMVGTPGQRGEGELVVC